MNTASTHPVAGAVVDLETMLPQLFARYPQTRHVFDRYGLRGCGGQCGPVETVGFFARTHGVDPGILLNEIRRAAREPGRGSASAPASVPADDATLPAIYRPFFAAGILVILTVGAAWGAWLLWQIGLTGSFTGLSIHDINAHGDAQILGWVGLFVMGFAYQAFPRIWHTTLAAPRVALAVLALMLAGIGLRTVAVILLAPESPAALACAMLGAALGSAAIVAFAVQIAATYRRGRKQLEPYVAFVLTAIACFVVQSIAGAWHTYAVMTAGTREALLEQVASFQAPLRDLQIHGFAMFMVLGVSLRMVPALFGVPEVAHRRAWCVFGLALFGVVAEVTLLIAYRLTGVVAFAAALLAPWIALACGVGLLIEKWRPWRAFPIRDRSAKFVRAAYGWLCVSLALLLLLPLYQVIQGTEFSHAYYGGIRHAITVGFVSLMILGIAAKVVPTLNGVDPRTLPSLLGPFLLVNVGCFLRVTLQILTDVHPIFFGAVGVSGVLELAGIAWWSAGILRILADGIREERSLVRPSSNGERDRSAASQGRSAAAGASAVAPQEGNGASGDAGIGPKDVVAGILARYPQTGAVFVRHGFAAIQNPVLRRTIARVTSLEDACRIRGIDLDELLGDLRHAAGLPNEERRPIAEPEPFGV